MTLKHDRQITISVCKSRKDTNLKKQSLTLSEFYGQMEIPRRSGETLAEYKALPKPQQDDLNDVGGYVAGSLSGQRRKASAVTGRDTVTLDFDNVPAGQSEQAISRITAQNWGCCIHSTRKHSRETPRLRVNIPLDRTVTPDEYVPIARLVAAQIGMDWVDKTTFEPSRLMSWPSCCADSEYIFEVVDKPLLSADFALNLHTVLYGDWRDPANWCGAEKGTDTIRALAKKQGDPTEKSGIVGAFCRKYDVFRALDELIPGTYTPVDTADNRYTFVGGSTTGGAIVYDGGKFLYSHHATDPCSGKLVNAFDLVRLHKFGATDDNAAPGTPVGRLPSYTAMREYAQSLPDVPIEAATAAADFAGLESGTAEDDGWKQQLDVSQAGRLKNSLNNIALILEHDSRFKGKLRKDIFNDRIEADSLPWDRPAGKPWDDTDSDFLRLWMERVVEGKVSISDIYTAVNTTADQQSFHPVKQYLEGLIWDGTPRLDSLFIDYLGAEDSLYTRAVARKSFTAAVARIMEPGCKYDTMCVLVGKQGRYKSTLLNLMGGAWFSDSLRTFEGREAEERLRGAWLIEISELQALDRSSVELVKSFLSKQSDRYRPAYGRMLREFPRQCVFFGSTNVADFLRDTTGGRRFWPVDIDVLPRKKSVVDDLPRERDQLWAEAVARYHQKEPLFLSGEVEQSALDIQESHRETDPWEGMLLDFISKPIPSDWEKWPLDRRRDFLSGHAAAGGQPLNLVERKKVSSTEFMCEVLNFAPGHLDKRDTMRVSKILRGLPGWESMKEIYRTPYAQVRGYIRTG